VARAKQTARADARRRHRLATRPIEMEAAEPSDDEPAAVSTAARSRSSAAAGRPSIGGGVFGSFRAAYRQPNIREDLAALPRLLLGRSFLAALGLIAVGFGAYELYPGYSGSSFLFQFLTYPPAIAPIFLAGFFAPRASYLLGLIVGVADAAAYSLFLVSVAPTLGTPVLNDLPTYILASLFWSAITGIFFASGAAWYRRFLQLTTPRRQPGGRANQPNRCRQPAAGGRRR